jgi:GNAT superfamily N-acetyltransferase
MRSERAGEPAPAALSFSREPADRPPASDLIEAMVVELLPVYGRIDGPRAPSARPQDFAPPGGSFLVGRLGDAVVCGGGVKRLSAACAEIKRMYVAPAMRGRGLARTLLGALEDEARRLGYRLARLDTGPEQPHARALYLSAGYRPIGDYNGNPVATFWAEKSLLAEGMRQSGGHPV